MAGLSIWFTYLGFEKCSVSLWCFLPTFLFLFRFEIFGLSAISFKDYEHNIGIELGWQVSNVGVMHNLPNEDDLAAPFPIKLKELTTTYHHYSRICYFNRSKYFQPINIKSLYLANGCSHKWARSLGGVAAHFYRLRYESCPQWKQRYRFKFTSSTLPEHTERTRDRYVT